MPTPSALFANLLFGLIGAAVFMYGKRVVNFPLIGIGLTLMAYTWFVSETWLLYGIGLALCAGVYWFRDWS
ncbi:hypothetical protein Q9Q94_03080 [Uliginosibacterium sp. 31-16]|uniref:hypothetical protein n=1 Tax=Uliginosibacterium sp. 31-16 TaxID=3068315 RepID=UPI00273E201B|nr:hypothetical protein [Uliginosibacterium sp. 31-16]MDP5238494.1 hypothetical protein [Uliginosibacterium sp. 31-16]